MNKVKEVIPYNEHAETPWRYNGNEIVSEADPNVGVAGGYDDDNIEFVVEAVNSYYPSREIIEKLDKHVSALISEIERACRSGDGLLNIPTVAADCLPVLTEARAFLNKNVKS